MAALHGFRNKMKIREKKPLVFTPQYGTKNPPFSRVFE